MLQDLHDGPINGAGQILQDMLDVLRHAQFARPRAVRKLPGGMGRRSVYYGSVKILTPPRDRDRVSSLHHYLSSQTTARS